MSDLPVMHCITIGNRPDLLRQTLESLRALQNLSTLAINDFNDAETNQVFKEMCPLGRIVNLGRHVGHHRAIDALYSNVATPYILHNEDDWEFSRTDFLQDALNLLETEPNISAVCLRTTDDMPLAKDEREKIVSTEIGGVYFKRLDNLRDQWHSFTFNPHLCRKSMWQGLDGYSKFEKERHLSRHLKRKGKFVAFLMPEACRHIDEGRSTTWIPSQFRRFEAWLRGERPQQ